MWFTFLIAVWGVCTSSLAEPNECKRAANGNYLRREVLLADRSLEEGIAIHWETNRLCIEKMLKPEHYEVGWLNLDNGSYSAIGELPGLCPLTIDQQLGTVYAGCRKLWNHGGIYKYESKLQQFERLSDEIEDIHSIYFADRLYYLDKDDKLTVADRRRQLVSELQDIGMKYFVVDSKGNKVFSSGQNIYFQKAGEMNIAIITSDEEIEGLAIDSHDVVYGFNGYSIFLIDTTSLTLQHVMNLPDYCGKLVFDKDGNFVYFAWEGNRLVRVVPCQP